jgi:hypothetical protein
MTVFCYCLKPFWFLGAISALCSHWRFSEMRVVAVLDVGFRKTAFQSGVSVSGSAGINDFQPFFSVHFLA